MGTVLQTTTADPAAGTQSTLAESALTLDTTKPMRALLLENIHPDATARLTKASYEVEARAEALSEDELIEAVRGVNLLGIRSRTHVTDRVLAAAPDLVAVGAFCIGVNQIDIAAAARRGVAAFNAPFSNTRSVVELVLAEIISLARRLPEKNMKMHAGVWDKSASGSHEVRGRRLGIVGYGNIGAARRLAGRLQAGIVTDESHGVTLARALRPVLDATNLIPPAPKPAHPRARGTEPPMTLALAQMHRATAHTGSWSALSAPRRSPLTGHPAFRPCTPCPTAHISIQIFTEFTSGASLRNAVQPRLTCNHGLICDRGSNGLLDLLPEVSRSPEERLSATASAQCPTAWGA